MPLKCSEWQVLTRDHTVLPATHTFIYEWNEPSCLYPVSIHQMALPERGSAHPFTGRLLFIYRPRKDASLNWPRWLTYIGRFTHISGHPSAAGQTQDRESSPSKDRRSTAATQPTMDVYHVA